MRAPPVPRVQQHHMTPGCEGRPHAAPWRCESQPHRRALALRRPAPPPRLGVRHEDCSIAVLPYIRCYGRLSRQHRKDHVRRMVASQACAVSEPNRGLTSNASAAMSMTVQPSPKAARSSSWPTRRGPKPPGWRSLKHIREQLPPDRSAEARLVTDVTRAGASKTWNSPPAKTVAKVGASTPE